MTKNLDFSQLRPRQDTFTDEDGTVYPFRSRMEFGGEDTAKATVIVKRLDFARKRLDRNPKDTDAMEKFEEANRSMLDLILPGVPKERRSQFALGQVAAIVEFWSKQQEIEEPEDLGEAEED